MVELRRGNDEALLAAALTRLYVEQYWVGRRWVEEENNLIIRWGFPEQ